MSPIFEFSSGIGKSDPQKTNLKVFLQLENFFYIFQILKVFFKDRISLDWLRDNDPYGFLTL